MPNQVKRVRLTTFICIVGLCSTFSWFDVAASPVPTASGVEARVVQLTNSERGNRGLARLRPNARLMRAAQLQAEQMARAGQTAHVLTSAAYPRAEDRLAAAGYSWQRYGENLAFGQSSPAAAVRDWMHSRGHRRNIVNPDFTELGVGYATDRAGRPYYVQLFASPVSS